MRIQTASINAQLSNSTIMAVAESGPFDLKPYEPELSKWFNNCKAQIPNYANADDKGAKEFAAWFHDVYKKKNSGKG